MTATDVTTDAPPNMPRPNGAIAPQSLHMLSVNGPARSTTRAVYEKRMEQVFDYVHAHLDEQLDLHRLADIACMSPCHWHRVYHSMLGETISATVKRLRLQRAADQLANTQRSVDNIAKDSGYSGTPAFNRAFKAAYGLPPAQYREAGSHSKYRLQGDQRGTHDFAVEIRLQEPLNCIAAPHTGRYLEVDRAFSTLFTVLHREQAIDASTQFLGVYFDDPGLVEPEKLQSLACAVTTKPVVDDQLEPYRIAGGYCAVLRHQGPYADMHAAYEWLYGKWLPTSGYEPADKPVFEFYLNDPRDTAPADLLVDICLPLAAPERRTNEEHC